ncbi:MAG: amidohydrolase family protein, partial [Nitrososphaerota archaeon]|nr:amidohydrolase family protein [Nitrososphaerota archaeon]
MASIYIKNAYIVTANGKGEIIKDGSIFIEDGEIKEVGKSDSMKAYRPEYLIDAAHKVVMPGLINTHVHLAQALLRGLVPDNVNLIEWLRDWVWPLQGNMSE